MSSTQPWPNVKNKLFSRSGGFDDVVNRERDQLCLPRCTLCPLVGSRTSFKLRDDPVSSAFASVFSRFSRAAPRTKLRKALVVVVFRG